MAVLLAVTALLGACGGDDGDEDLTLTERCVRDVVALYEKHDLPFTEPEERRPEICEKLLEDEGIETAAEWEIYRRQADKELRDLSE